MNPTAVLSHSSQSIFFIRGMRVLTRKSGSRVLHCSDIVCTRRRTHKYSRKIIAVQCVDEWTGEIDDKTEIKMHASATCIVSFTHFRGVFVALHWPVGLLIICRSDRRRGILFIFWRNKYQVQTKMATFHWVIRFFFGEQNVWNINTILSLTTLE